ncbi:helix-turn-helix domain-containing protein [Leptospira sp. SA-E8]|uniref:AraC family transcriptional regulator n=1 Tax=Leptospira sp. SA-E8 TaxID=3422259 RepID=UPI003EBB84C8
MDFLWISDEMVFFSSLFGPYRENSRSYYRNCTAKIAISLETPSEIFLPGKEVIRFGIALVPPNLMHKVRYPGTGAIVLLIDPSSSKFARIRANLSRGILHFGAEEFPDLREKADQIIRGKVDYEIAAEFAEDVIRSLEDLPGFQSEDFPIDPRIFEIIRYLKNLSDLPSEIDLLYLSKRVGLSPGRFRHLFYENIGISLKRFLMYLKIRRAADCFASGRNLVQASIAGGFADAAHFSRSFRLACGQKPSNILLSREWERPRILVRNLQETEEDLGIRHSLR